ncbi:HipA family kinase [Streptomyces odontomachi]|uniref:HipA family kinase n=1 Tax=Streptomyces odontomachi TaxID=2944940 RepID=UPI00210E64D7|nr:HipA family kinase [Streptomyces sp. ODS25]
MKSGAELREVTATRYVEPLHAGGSVPGVVEADDLGTYVAKFTGSAQGRKALVAEVIVGELGRRLGLRVPELVRVVFDPAVAAHEPHQEVQDLLRASAGLNLGMDLLPGAVDFSAADRDAVAVGPLEAGRIVWLDALTANVDRTVHSPNLMVWPGAGPAEPRLWLIDHGAALVFHHRWDTAANAVGKVYDFRAHALGGYHPDTVAADAELAPRVTEPLLREIVARVPDEWLAGEPGFTGPDAVRAAYVGHLAARARASATWLPTGFHGREQLAAETARRVAATEAARPGWLKHVPDLHGRPQTR